MTKISIFLKYGALSDTKDDDTENTNKMFTKTEYNSGDMANIILMQRKIKRWVRNA